LARRLKIWVFIAEESDQAFVAKLVDKLVK